MFALWLGLGLLWSAPAPAQDEAKKKIYVRVQVIVAAGKTSGRPSFDPKIEHLRQAFAQYPYKTYSLKKSHDAVLESGAEKAFDIGFQRELRLAPSWAPERARYPLLCKAKMLRVRQAEKKDDDKKRYELLGTFSYKAADGTPLTVGDQGIKNLDPKKDIHLLVVMTLQSKPFP